MHGRRLKGSERPYSIKLTEVCLGWKVLTSGKCGFIPIWYIDQSSNLVECQEPELEERLYGYYKVQSKKVLFTVSVGS